VILGVRRLKRKRQYVTTINNTYRFPLRSSASLNFPLRSFFGFCSSTGTTAAAAAAALPLLQAICTLVWKFSHLFYVSGDLEIVH
jgi:hypothetical protein